MSLPEWAEKWKENSEIQQWLEIMYTASDDTTAKIDAQKELYKYITFGNEKEECIAEWLNDINNMPYESDPEANVYHIKHRWVPQKRCELDWFLSDTLSEETINKLSTKENILQENIVNWWCYMDHYLLTPYSNLDYLKNNIKDLKEIIKTYESDTWQKFYQLYEKKVKADENMKKVAAEEASNQELPSDKTIEAEKLFKEAEKSLKVEIEKMKKVLSTDELNNQHSGQKRLKEKITELRLYLYRLKETDNELTGIVTLTEMREYLKKLTELISRHATTDIEKKFLDPYIYPTLNKWYLKIKPTNDPSVHETILSQFAKWIFEIRLDQIDTGDETKNQKIKRFGKKTRRDSVIYLIDEGKKLFTERGSSPEFWTILNKNNIEKW
jgi:hypothetical protein